jgi:hypothetical protein
VHKSGGSRIAQTNGLFGSSSRCRASSLLAPTIQVGHPTRLLGSCQGTRRQPGDRPQPRGLRPPRPEAPQSEAEGFCQPGAPSRGVGGTCAQHVRHRDRLCALTADHQEPAIDPAAPSVDGPDLSPGASARIYDELQLLRELDDRRARRIGGGPGRYPSRGNEVRRHPDGGHERLHGSGS